MALMKPQKTIRQLAKEHGIKCTTLRMRLERGWGMKRALSEGVRYYHRDITAQSADKARLTELFGVKM